MSEIQEQPWTRSTVPIHIRLENYGQVHKQPLSIRVSLTDSVAAVKEHIKCSKGVTGKLWYGKSYLDDCSSLQECEVTARSTLKLQSFSPQKRVTNFTVSVKLQGFYSETGNCEPLKLRVLNNTTIHDLKHKIQDEIGMRVDEQLLKQAGKPVPNRCNKRPVEISKQLTLTWRPKFHHAQQEQNTDDPHICDAPWPSHSRTEANSHNGEQQSQPDDTHKCDAPWPSHSRREVIIKSHHREQQSYPGSPSLIYDMKVEIIPKKVPNGKGLLGFVAQIGGWWHAKKLGLHLGLTDPQLSRIEEKHQQDPEERSYEMFVSWKRTKGAYATWRALARACREVCDLKLVDVVVQLASVKDMCDQEYPLQVPNDDDAETATKQPSPRASIVMSGEQAPIQESCGGSAVMKESTVIAKRGAAPRMAANDHEEPVDYNQLATEIKLGPNDWGFVGRQLAPVCSKWREIGLELMKVKPTFLDNFEEATTPQSCLLRMLQHWLRSDPVPTWEKILNALRSPTVRNECLATQIEWKFCS